MRSWTSATLLFWIMCSIPSIGSSQTKFSIGLKTGLNFSSIAVDPDPYPTLTKSGVTAFVVAAQMEMIFGRMFAVQVEPGYSKNGSKWTNQAGESDTRSASKIDIPILFKVLFLTGNIQPYAFLGPNIGIVISATQSLQLQNGSRDNDIKDQISSLDFGLAFGGGTKYNITPRVALTGDIRYVLGLSNLDNPQQQQVPAAAAGSVKTRGFIILFGVLFAI